MPLGCQPAAGVGAEAVTWMPFCRVVAAGWQPAVHLNRYSAGIVALWAGQSGRDDLPCAIRCAE